MYLFMASSWSWLKFKYPQLYDPIRKTKILGVVFTRTPGQPPWERQKEKNWGEKSIVLYVCRLGLQKTLGGWGRRDQILGSFVYINI